MATEKSGLECKLFDVVLCTTLKLRTKSVLKNVLPWCNCMTSPEKTAEGT